MITPNPDTNPELFEKITDVDRPIEKDYIFLDDKYWRTTALGEDTNTPRDTCFTYYRRKPKTESKMKMKWNRTENEVPSKSNTVLMTDRPSEVAESSPYLIVGHYSGLAGAWYNNRSEKVSAPKFWMAMPNSMEVDPVKEKPVTIKSDGTLREVEFSADGSVTVGCTTVDSATMDKIIERRAKTKKG